MKTLRTKAHQKLVEELKRSRLNAGLTQAKLARALDVQQSWVAKTENGERRLDVVEFAAWLDECGELQNASEIIADIQSIASSSK